jgi:carbon starvation protein CstA
MVGIKDCKEIHRWQGNAIRANAAFCGRAEENEQTGNDGGVTWTQTSSAALFSANLLPHLARTSFPARILTAITLVTVAHRFLWADFFGMMAVTLWRTNSSFAHAAGIGDNDGQ